MMDAKKAHKLRKAHRKIGNELCKEIPALIKKQKKELELKKLKMVRIQLFETLTKFDEITENDIM